MSRHFSDLLLSVQDTPDFRERYEREVKAMFEKKLTPAQKIGLWVFAIVMLALGVLSAWAFFVWAADQPMRTRSSYALLAVGSLAIGIGLIRIAMRESMDIRMKASMQTGGISGFLIGPAVALLIISAQQTGTAKSYMVIAAVILLMTSAVNLIGGQIRVSELNMKEELLGIKLKLADMEERLPEKK